VKDRTFLICLIGIDGSGKTTIAKLLVNSLRLNGYKCNYVYGRFRPKLSKPIVDLGKRLFLSNKNIYDSDKYSYSKSEVAKKHSNFLLIYQYIILLDYSLQLLFGIYLPRMLGNSIVCDRYVYDTVINDIPKTSNSPYVLKNLLNRFFKVAPSPDLTFFIDISEDIAYSRKDDTPSIEYLIERRKIYIWLAEEYNLAIIDGTKDINTIRAEIERRIYEWTKQ